MKLRKKLIIIVGLAWLLFIGIVYIGTNFYLLKNIKQYEQTEFENDIGRVHKSIYQHLYTLGTFTSDWGYWNDAFDYVAGKNPSFVSENVDLLTLSNSNINFMMYLNKKGEILFGIATNAGNDRLVAYPKGLENYIYPGSILEKHTQPIVNIKGLAKVANGILLIASAAVSSIEGNKPINGTIITGRYFTKNLLQAIANDVSLMLTLYSEEDFKKNSKINNLIESAKKNVNVNNHIFYESETIAYGYTVLRDIYNVPIGVIKVTLPRTNFLSGLKAINYYLIALFAAGLMLSVLIWVLLKSLILNRIEMLDKNIQYINKEQNFSSRLSVTHDDEIASLKIHFNKLMQNVQTSHEETNQHIEQLKISQNRLENMNKRLINEINERKQAEAKAKSLSDSLVLASRRAGMTDIANSILYSVGNILNHMVTSISLIKENLHAYKDNQFLLEEFTNIQNNADQMKNVILMQNSLRAVTEVTEEVKVSKLLEDSLLLNKAVYKKANITIIKDYQFNESVKIDRVKLLHILVSIIKYAIDLLVESNAASKIIIVSTARLDNERFTIRIGYKDYKISGESMSKIMSLGFNEKHADDNFGLQTSVMFCREMGGSLSVENANSTTGTMFVVILPVNGVVPQ